MTDLDRLKKRLVTLQSELADTEIAVKVLERLHGVGSVAAPVHGDGGVTQQKGKPFVTLRRKHPVPRGVSGEYRSRIRDLLKDGVKLTSKEIGDQFGLATGEQARKPMSNALYQMRAKGDLQRDQQLRYHLATPALQP